MRSKTNKQVNLSMMLIGWIAFFLVAGCGDDFLPQSYLHESRLLAIIADPVEVGPQDESALLPIWHVVDGQNPIEHHWTFCPYTLGAQAGFRCAFPSCAQEVPALSDGSVRANAASLLQQCISSFSGGPSGGLPAQIPSTVEVSFEYQAVFAGGKARQAVFRQKLWIEQTPKPNLLPVIASVFIGNANVSIGEQAQAVAKEGETTVRVVVDPASLDLYQDGTGTQMTEEPIAYFYNSAGRFDAELTAGSDSFVTWKAEKLEQGQDQALIYVVVRDLRGGQAVAGPFELPISP